MVLEFQEIEFFLDRGLDQGVTEKLSQGFAVLDNVSWRRDGAASKRWGYDQLGTGTLDSNTGSLGISQVTHLTGTFRDSIEQLAIRESSNGPARPELIAFGSGSHWSYSPALDRWIERDRRRSCSIRVEPIPAAATLNFGATSAVINNLRCIAWRAGTFSDGNYYSRHMATVQDATTGEVILPAFSLTSLNGYTKGLPQVVPVSSSFFIVYAGGTDGTDLQFRRISATDPTDQTLQTTVESYSFYEVGDLERGFEAYTTHHGRLGVTWLGLGDNRVQTNTYSSDGTNQSISAINGLNVNAILGATVHPDGVHLAVLSSSALHAVNMIALGTDNLTQAGVQTNLFTSYQNNDGRFINDAVGIASGTASTLWLFGFRGHLSGGLNVTGTLASDTSEELGTRINSYVHKMLIVGSSSITTQSLGAIHHIEVDSYPFTASIAHPDGTTRREFLVHTKHITDQDAMGYVMDLSGNVWGTYDSDLAFPHVLSKPRPSFGPDGAVHVPTLRSTTIFQDDDSSSGQQFSVAQNFGGYCLPLATIANVSFKLGVGTAKPLSVSDYVLHQDGQLRHYDGIEDAEAGFHRFPYAKPFPTSSARPDGLPTFGPVSGSRIAAGSYLYQFTYSKVDANGREHRSNPGRGATVVLTSSVDRININGPMLNSTDRDEVFIDIWRTENNGAIPYRVTGLLSSGSVDRILNTTGSQWTFTDRVLDADLVSQEPLYTVGEDPNDRPPSALSMAKFDDRVWLVEAARPSTLWFSKVLSPGLGPEWVNVQTLDVGEAGGPIVSLVVLDDKLVAFKERSIFIIYGSQGNYAVREISSTLGTISDSCVAAVSGMGIVFVAADGVHLLGRDLSFQFIGKAVEDDIEVGDITSILVDPEQSALRFMMRDGKQLMFDLQRQMWTRHSFSGSIGTSIDTSVIWAGQHIIAGRTLSGSIATGSSLVLGALSGTFLDGTSPFDSTIQTPWYHLAGLQGFQRVSKLDLIGTFASGSQLELGVEFDYGDRTTFDYEATINVSDFVNAVSGSTFKLTHHLRHQKCQAVRFTIRDITSGTTPSDFSVEGIRLKVGVLPGARHIPTGRRLG